MAQTTLVKETAASAFLAELDHTEASLEMISELIQDKLNRTPESVHWGHVGSLKHANELMLEALRVITEASK
jgi:hypothetical protein